MEAEIQEYSIPGLYYKYKKASDKEIREQLDKLKVVVLTNKGEGSIHGYYPLSKESMDKICKKPRGVSLSFDAIDTEDEPIIGLEVYKTITFLVKSTSRFFLKPDIGEIIDQISLRDSYSKDIKAIEYKSSAYEELPDTDGEHFIMKASLLKEKD